MKNKWNWLENRIKECGYKNVRQFAIINKMLVHKLYTMINTGELNLPKDKILTVAEELKIDLKSLIQYNNDEVDNVVFLENSLPAVNQIKVPYFNIYASAGDGYYNDNEYINSFITLTSGKFEAPIKNIFKK